MEHISNHLPTPTIEPYATLEDALAHVEAAMDWIEHRPNWTKDKYLRSIWRNVERANRELRIAYFTCPGNQ